MTEGSKKFEQKEGIPTVETISGPELKKLIYQGNGGIPDARFLSLDQGGVFEYFFISNLDEKPEAYFYPIVKFDNKIVAICELKKSLYKENEYWLMGVSVDPSYRGQHFSSIVLEEVFLFAQREGATLRGSRYSDEGSLRLKSVIQRLAEKYKIRFDSDDDRK